MPRPEGDEGGGQPENIKFVDPAQAGGMLVTDPAYTQAGRLDGWVLSSKHPGLVGDPGPEEHPPTVDRGIRAGKEQVTDPPEGESGKGA